MLCFFQFRDFFEKKNKQKKTLEYCHVNTTVRESPFCMYNIHIPFLSILAVMLNVYEANTVGGRVKHTQRTNKQQRVQESREGI